MGAVNIGFILKFKASEKEVKEAFLKQQEEDHWCNGTRHGYSADFQTVDKVICHFGTVMESRKQAENYCLEHAEKWEYVIAVYFKAENSEEQNSTHTLIAGWGAS